jgi:transcriptional regulator with XRE-family HTH domain
LHNYNKNIIVVELRVKEILKEKGILFKDLADKIGVTDVGLRKQVQGNPTIETLSKIASALNVPVSDLFEQPAGDTITCPKCGTKFRMEK